MQAVHQETFMGFKNASELICAMFKPRQINLKNIMILAMSFTLILNFIPVLEMWVWSPFWTLIVFYVVVIWDFISAFAANNKTKKEGFVTQKAKKVPVVLMAYTMLFVVLHLMGKVVTAFEMDSLLNPTAFDYLAKGVYFLCFAINFLSAVKHMAILGLVPNAVAKVIEKFIDVHKNKIETVVTKTAVEPTEAPTKTDDNGNI